MFTGITEETGKVQYITDRKIKIECVDVLLETLPDDSISVNGVCLTVTKLGDNFFEADLSPETYNVTALKYLKTGMLLNLERAMRCDGRFGGHIVSGHVDGIGKVLSIVKNSESYNLKIKLDDSESKYVVKKGSITVNGISLTIADINDNVIEIAVIPHTYDKTNISILKSGDFVNIEVDIFAKYIEKFLSTVDNRTEVNLKFLQENGFC